MIHKPAFPEVEITLKAADCEAIMWYDKGQWHIASLDVKDGKEHTLCDLDADKAAAIMRLFITGGEHSGDYALVGNLFDGWPSTARIIP